MVKLRRSLLGMCCNQDEDAEADESIETCGVQRRAWVAILSLGIFLYGIYNTCYFMLLFYLHFFSMKQTQECTGIGCDEILSCDGTRFSSYHFRLCILTIGSLYFGHLGLLACFEKYAIEMFQFSCWLLTISVVHATVFALDAVYFYACDRQYSYNVIMEAVMWPYRGLPFGYLVQYEVSQMTSYDSRHINSLTGVKVGSIHGFWLCVVAAFWLYAAYEAFILSMRFHYGLAGLGTTFSIATWKENLETRYDIKDTGYGTLGAAFNTGMDLEWDEDEYYLQGKLRPPSWARPGFMPGRPIAMPASMATSYDGFRDDRRNVLL